MLPATIEPKELLRRYGIEAAKSFGQNFLLDLNLTRKIVRESAAQKGDAVIEVGPGPGSLTIPLLEAGVRLTVIEMDRRLFPLLEEVRSVWPEHLRIIQADAMTFDYSSMLAGSDKTHIISNLPYNISAPLLTGWLKMADKLTSMTLMFQKEVAERITATPGNKSYGRLSVISQWRCAIAHIMTLPPAAFTPRPKVYSTVLRFTPRMDVDFVLHEHLEEVLKAAFGQRRKMLRGSLAGLFPNVQQALSVACINPEARAEDLSVEDYIKLANFQRGRA